MAFPGDGCLAWYHARLAVRLAFSHRNRNAEHVNGKPLSCLLASDIVSKVMTGSITFTSCILRCQCVHSRCHSRADAKNDVAVDKDVCRWLLRVSARHNKQKHHHRNCVQQLAREAGMRSRHTNKHPVSIICLFSASDQIVLSSSSMAWQAGSSMANQGARRIDASGSSGRTELEGGTASDDGNVWASEQLEPTTIGTLTTTDTSRNTSSPLHPSLFQPPPRSPLLGTNAANLPSDDQEAAVSDDSDFELVDPDTPSQLDGPPERTNRSYNYIPTAITEQYAARLRNSRQARQERFDNDEDEDSDAVPSAYNASGSSRMEGGNDYEQQPEWRQAGPNADAQDLAGPGEHGFLECTVTKPQKEGEGTQNVYVSYLVTTDVRIAAFGYVKLQLTDPRPTSSRSKPPIRQRAADSPISSSSTRRSSKSTRNARSRLCQRSRTCHTFAAIVLAPTSQPVAHTPYNASSSA
jgi:hypothetical protein